MEAAVFASGPRRRVLGVPERRPAQAELADMSEYIVAFRHGALLDPRHEIIEGGLAHRILDAAMSGPAHCALHQKRRRAGLLRAPAIILLEPERHPEIG